IEKRITGEKSADDAHDVGFLHDQKVFAVELDFGARPFAEQDAVADLDVESDDLAAFVTGAGADGDDLAFLRLFLRGVRNDDAALGLFLGLDTTNDDAVVKRAEVGACHCLFPRSNDIADRKTDPMIDVSTPLWRVL